MRAKDGVFLFMGLLFCVCWNLGFRLWPQRAALHIHVQTIGDMRATGLTWCKENPYLGLGYPCWLMNWVWRIRLAAFQGPSLGLHCVPWFLLILCTLQKPCQVWEMSYLLACQSMELWFLPLEMEQPLFPLSIYMALCFILYRWDEEPKGSLLHLFLSICSVQSLQLITHRYPCIVRWLVILIFRYQWNITLSFLFCKLIILVSSGIFLGLLFVSDNAGTSY